MNEYDFGWTTLVGGGGGGGGGTRKSVFQTPVKVRVFKTRKGWSWEERAFYGGMVGAVSPKTYDTKSNAVRAARRRVQVLKSAVVVVDA